MKLLLIPKLTLILLQLLSIFIVIVNLQQMSRLKKIKDSFAAIGADSFLVKSLPNIRYISGFSGSAANVLLTKDKNYFITDFRYKTQSAKEVYDDFEVIIYVQNSMGFLNELSKKHGLSKTGFESNILTYADYLNLKNDFAEIEFVPADSLIENIVSQKNEKEIELTRKAVNITDKTFSELLNIIKPGMTEREISAEISFLQKIYGADCDSFEPIVASGVRSAFPHARPTDKIIENGELLKLDFGCTVEGMKSDMTRTIAVGEISEECKNIYKIVKEAQLRALEKVKAGVPVKEVDSAARDYITEMGFGENFGHGLGHGLGYDIHERPSLNQRTDFILEVNNIITIEPGIYVEGLGGVRIEDDVAVTENGCEILNKSTKELITV
ncbi:MAG TPA: Xaa-Pro dipeptidase [Bacteroidetes bacterium]|nr:Xaa-Pro dipeptidase [Bacteroidota bacterium]